VKDRIGIRGKRSGRYTPFPKGLRFGSEREMSEEQRVELAKGGTQDDKREEEEWFHILRDSYATNAAMPGPLTPRHKCTVYGEDYSPQ
jgi:hypothetical protein